MKKAIVSLLLCALLLACFSVAALGENYAWQTFNIDQQKQFRVPVPTTWTKTKPEGDEYADWPYKPVFVFTSEDGSHALLIFDIYITGGTLTLDDAAANLEKAGVSVWRIVSDGVPMLEGYSSALGIYGRAFCNLKTDGYYIVAAMPGKDGTLIDQDPVFLTSFSNIELFTAEETATAASAPTAAPQSNSESPVEAAKAKVAELEAQISYYKEQQSELRAQLMDLEFKLQTAEMELENAHAELEKAMQSSFCPSCGYELPEGNVFKFCPQCGSPLQ